MSATAIATVAAGGNTSVASTAANVSGCTALMNLNACVEGGIVKLVSMRKVFEFLSYANKRTLQGAWDHAGGLGSEAWHSAFVAVAGYQQEQAVG